MESIRKQNGLTMRPPLIFDLDNTLLRCSVYYEQARRGFQELMRETLGVKPDQARKAYWSVHEQKVAQNGGQEWRWFVDSFSQAYRQLAEQRGQGIQPEVLQKTRELGLIVPNAPYEPYEGALETVQAYRDAGFRTALYTKGGARLQGKKIARHNLEQLFDEIRIVPRKTPEDVTKLAHALEVNGHPGLMIGDSRRDDVRCGQQAGLKTVLVDESCNIEDMEYHQRYEAEHDHYADFYIQAVRQLPTVVLPTSRQTLAAR